MIRRTSFAIVGLLIFAGTAMAGNTKAFWTESAAGGLTTAVNIVNHGATTITVTAAFYTDSGTVLGNLKGALAPNARWNFLTNNVSNSTLATLLSSNGTGSVWVGSSSSTQSFGAYATVYKTSTISGFNFTLPSGTVSSSADVGDSYSANSGASAAQINFDHDKSFGEGGTGAVVGDVALTKGRGFYGPNGKALEAGALGSLTYNSDGTYTATGSNSEAITVTFYRTSDTTTAITQDITDISNYADLTASPPTQGALYDLLNSTQNGLDESKVKMRISIVATRTFTGRDIASVTFDLTTGIIAFSTGTAASYDMTGTGSITMANGSTFSMDTLTVTAASNGQSITGESTSTVPMDDGNYTIVCTFDENGCISNTVEKGGVTVGEVSLSGSDVIYTDSITGETVTLSSN